MAKKKKKAKKKVAKKKATKKKATKKKAKKKKKKKKQYNCPAAKNCGKLYDNGRPCNEYKAFHFFIYLIKRV